jgi:hypothetical protein
MEAAIGDVAVTVNTVHRDAKLDVIGIPSASVTCVGAAAPVDAAPAGAAATKHAARIAATRNVFGSMPRFILVPIIP